MKFSMKFVVRLLSIIIISIFLTSSVTAQSGTEDPTQDHRYKDPNTALIVGAVLVGGGHFYAGESGTGAILLGTAVGAPLLGAAATVNSLQMGPFYLGVAASLGAWIYSIVDAPKAARRTNTKNGLVKKIQISPNLLTTKTTGETGYGVSMKINF